MVSLKLLIAIAPNDKGSLLQLSFLDEFEINSGFETFHLVVINNMGEEIALNI